MDGFTERLKKSRLILPPLADYTDYPYRSLLTSFKPHFLCTEMVSPEGLLHNNPKTLDMIKVPEGDHIDGVQLVGADPESMGKAAPLFEAKGFGYIDINMGCTVRVVSRTGAGISLMGTPDRAVKVTSSVIENTGLPVTCKMRLGVNDSSKNVVELASRLVDVGVSAITVHGRSGEKKFGLDVEHDMIKRVVEAVDVPVIGNGGIFNGGDALEMMEKTGVAAVMPGRGLIGNPWIVKDISAGLNGFEYIPPSLDERKKVFTRHLGLLSAFFGERTGVLKARRIIGKYFQGAIRLSRMKLKAQRASTVDEMTTLMDRLRVVNDQVHFV